MTSVSRSAAFWKTLLLSALLFAVAFAIYFPALNYKFSNFDDVLHVTANPYLQPLETKRIAYFWRYPFDPSPVAGVQPPALSLRAPYQSIYTPLSFTLHAVTAYYARAGNELSALPFHGLNIVLHGLNTVLCFLLLLRFVRSQWAAAAGALLFALHPLQTEAVVWVTGQNGLLAQFFSLLTALAYFVPLRADGEKPKYLHVWHALAFKLFFLSMKAKPSADKLTPVLLVLENLYFPRDRRQTIVSLAPLFLLCVLCAAVNSSLHRNDSGGVDVLLWLRPFVMGDSWTFYLSKLVAPFGLVLDYGRRPDLILKHVVTYLAWTIPVGLGLFLFKTKPNESTPTETQSLWRGLTAGYAFFLLMLLPTSGIIKYYFHTYSTVADRYVYAAMPSAALALAATIAWLLTQPKRKFALAIPAAFLLGCVPLTIHQVSVWRTDEALWTNVLKINKSSWVADVSLGRIYLADHQLQRALLTFEDARKLNPGASEIHFLVGDTYLEMAREAEAEKAYREGLRLSPGSAYGELKLGTLLVQRNQPAEAAALLDSVLQKVPANPEARGNLGMALLRLGQFDAGEKMLHEAMNLGFSKSKGQFNLGVAAAMRGQFAIAVDWLRTAAASDPNSFDIQYNLGLALQKTGDTTAARQALQHALTLRPKDPNATRALKSLPK